MQLCWRKVIKTSHYLLSKVTFLRKTVFSTDAPTPYLPLHPRSKSLFIRKYLTSTFFRSPKVHYETKTKSWRFHGQTCSCLNFWTLMTMKNMKSSNFYKKKSQQSLNIISIYCFSFTVLFTFYYCYFDYFLWCVANRRSV